MRSILCRNYFIQSGTNTGLHHWKWEWRFRATIIQICYNSLCHR